MEERPNYFIRRVNSFRFAGKGIWAFVWGEEHANLHVLAALVVVSTGLYTGLSTWEWCVIVLCIGMVFAAEMANSAIERLTDLVHPHFNDQAGKVKDIAAGGVLVAATSSAVVAALIFWDKF